MTRMLIIITILALLYPTTADAVDQPSSHSRVCLIAHSTAFTFGLSHKNMAPRPTILASANCPDDVQLPPYCRCDGPGTCGDECASGEFYCDDNGYCECR